MRRGGRQLARVLVLLAVMLAVVACNEGESQDPQQEPEPALELKGRMLTTGGVRDPLMQIHDLDTDTTERYLLPGNPQVIDAFWNESFESAYVLTEGLQTGLFYEIDPDGRVRRFGEALPGYATTADLGNTTLLATVCRRKSSSVLVMDVEGRQQWDEVASGCIGTLSPDGRDVVFSPDGRALWTIAASGQGEARKIADLENLVGVEPADVPEARVESIDWGDGGIALEVSIGDRRLVVLLGEDGTPDAIAGDPGVDQLALAWQPDGDQLAVATFSSAFNDAEAVIRMVDADRGEAEVVALDPSRFFNMTWSPDGAYLVATTSQGRWLFVDAGGDWLTSEHVITAGAIDWAP